MFCNIVGGAIANDIRKPRRDDGKQATGGASFHRVWSESATEYRPHPLWLDDAFILDVTPAVYYT